MRFKCFLVVTGLALLLGPTVGMSQFGGQPGGFGGPPGGFGGQPGGFGGRGAGGQPGAFGGGRGGGMGGFGSMDPNERWNQMTGGKAVWKRSEITDPNMLQHFDRVAQMVGATSGEITKEQYTAAMRELGQRFGGAAPAPAVAAKGAAAAGPQWEYKVQTRVSITELGKNDFAAGLNKLGDEGWELVAVTGVVGSGFDSPAPRPPEYFFKRRKGSAAREEPAAASADDFQIRVMPLKHAQARALVEILQEVFAGKGNAATIDPDPRTNMLIIRGSPKQVEELAARLDIPGADEPGRQKKP